MTVPWAVANSSYKRQQSNPAVTEIIEIKGREGSNDCDSQSLAAIGCGTAIALQQVATTRQG